MGIKVDQWGNVWDAADTECLHAVAFNRFGVPLAESLKSLLWLRLQDAAVLATAAAW